MGFCDCLPPFTIENNKVLSAILYILVQFHKANHSYILRIEKFQDKSLGEHQHMYFSKKKFGHLKLRAADENVNNLLLALASDLRLLKNAI